MVSFVFEEDYSSCQVEHELQLGRTEAEREPMHTMEEVRST